MSLRKLEDFGSAVLPWLAGPAMLAALYLIFMVVPTERDQGIVQRIFYFHVPSAWTAFVGFFTVCGASLVVLFRGSEYWDRVAKASAEVGMVFCTLVLLTGPIWARPIWGTWWTWDARLTLTLMLFFLFIGYQVLRGAVTDRALRPRYAAVVGICGLILLPFIHLSVYLFRTLHPQPIVLKPSAPSLPPEMLVTLLLSFGVFTLLYVGFVMQRYALGETSDA